MGLRTFRITVAYDGTAYAGWQVQRDVTTVQGVLEHAAERLNGEPGRVLGAGRTDAGVHARGQAARFRTTRDLTAARVPHALNAFLPEDVVVVQAEEVPADFHPIGDAVGKHYRYTFLTSEFSSPFDDRYVLRIEAPLDVDAMAVAANHLVGSRDFAMFEKAGSPRDHTVRNLTRLDVVADGPYIQVHLVANGFLYGMARNLSGTLLRVGQRLLDAASMPEALSTADVRFAGPCLPPHGLCLMAVHYPRRSV